MPGEEPFLYGGILNSSLGSGLDTEMCKQCINKFVGEQYNALGVIYERFGTFLLGLVFFFIIYAILEKIEYASEKKEFVFLKWKFPLNVSDDFIKIIRIIKNVFFYTMFALSMIYYFLGMEMATNPIPV